MESLNKKQNNFTAIKWIYSKTKHFMPAVLLISLISVLNALCTVALALISKDLLDIATNSQNGSVLKTSALLFGVVLAEIVLIAADTMLRAYVSGRLTVSMRSYLFGVVSKRSYASVSAYHSGDLLNRFTSDNDVVISSLVSIIPNLASMAAKIIGGISAMLVLDSRIAIIILVVGISVPALGRIINKSFKQLHKQCQKTEGQVRSFTQECFENLVVLKSFEGEITLSEKLKQYLNKNYTLKIKRSWISLLTHISLYAFFTAGYYAIMVWGAGSIAAGAITYGTLMAFLQLVQQLRAPLQNISAVVPQYYSAIASAERLMEIEVGEYDPPPADSDTLNAIKSDFKGISVKAVTFAYKNEPILENCSFEVPKGKITAITGESGSGKSTVFKIILGLYRPQSGSVLVNGTTELDPSLRGILAYVPQGNMVLSGTVRENITLCNASVSEGAVITAAKAAEIYDYIDSLPDGLDTMLTERGGGLSEGQIQRISIARALLTDAPVLLLDEATSALDEATETKVLNNIKAMSDKTVLFVTHRNTSLKVCDRIVHVENKKFTLIKE